MKDAARTIVGPLPGSAPPEHESLPGGGRKSSRRRTQIGVSLTLFALTLFGGSYYLLSRVEEEEPVAPTEESMTTHFFKQHKYPVLCLDLSADGKTIASGDESGKICIWDGTTRKPRIELVGHPKGVISIAVSADGKLVVSGDRQGYIKVWDLEAGRQKHSLFAHGGGVVSLAIYPTKNFVVTAGRDKRLGLWNIADGKLIRERKLEEFEFTDLALTPDGLRIVTGDTGGKLRVWNLASLDELEQLGEHTDAVTSVSVSALGSEMISSGKNGAVRRWDLRSRRMLGEIPPPGVESVVSVALSPGGTRALSIADQGTARLWSLEDKRLIESYGGISGPTSCGAFMTGGTFVVLGSLDRSIGLRKTPLASVLEVERMAEAERNLKDLALKYEKFGEQMRLARQTLDAKREKEAAAAFRTAGAGMSKDSLEYRLAIDAADEIDRKLKSADRYKSLCEAGQKAMEREEFQEAIVQFSQAKEALKDVPGGESRKEADEGLKAARRADALKQALEGLVVKESVLDFTEYSPRRPLDRGREFAFLLTKKTPPMASATTPLEWHISMTTTVAFPDEEVSLLVQIFSDATGAEVGKVEHPFVAGGLEQSFLGKAVPPSTGWAPGVYELRTTLITPQKKTEQGTQEFKMGRLDWTEKKITLSPEMVQQAHYVYDCGMQIEKGEALSVHATGTIAPAPTMFYRDLLSDNRIAAPVAGKPEGIVWTKQISRLEKYRMVDTKCNFGALVLRIGYDGLWVPYRDNVPPLPMITKGPLQLSINSVVPREFSYAEPKKFPLSATDRSYWSAEGGSFSITILRGRFDFPIPLSDLERGQLLLRYFSDLNASSSKKK